MSGELPFYTAKTTPVVYILCGIPTSGKTTWAVQQTNVFSDLKYKYISRDMARMDTLGPNYKQNTEDEKFITKYCDMQLKEAIRLGKNIIIDNTHCRDKYLEDLFFKFSTTEYDIVIRFFDLPLWKAYYRNIKRYLTDGKWIPMKVLKNMKHSYDKINKNKYRHGHLL